MEELKPQESSFKLASTGHTYHLRKLALSDEIWIKQNYGDKLHIVFDPISPDFEAICRIVYRQIDNREDFVLSEVTVVEEDGTTVTKKLGGYQLLAEAVVGQQEKLDLIAAFNECAGLSRPEPKKKAIQAVKRMIGLK